MGMLRDFEATCSLDGTTFTYASTPSYSTFGRALDGLPWGSWTFPLKLPECPACGLAAVFGELTAEEAGRAAELVDSEAWRTAREETSYWRLNLAEMALGRANGWTRVDRLLSATWQTYGDAERYGRYAQALGQTLDEVSDALKAENLEAWAMFQSFVANVERQAGDFKRAAARLDLLDPAAVEMPDVAQRIARTRALIADGDRGREMPRD